MKEEYKCECRNPDWVVFQTSFQNGFIQCMRCDTRLRFELVTIEYTA